MQLSVEARNSLFKRVIIDFNCYADVDVGLIRLIGSKYMDDSIFNRSLIKGNLLQAIKILYNREEENPLYDFANVEVSKKDLDDYYSEFLKDEREKILSLAVTTDIKKFLQLLHGDGNIEIIFLCKDELEASLLYTDKFIRDCCKIVIDSDDLDLSTATQFYFKYVNNPLVKKYIYRDKTYYFSTCKLNFDQELQDIRNDNHIIDAIIYSRSNVAIIDLYNKQVLDNSNEGE